MRRILLMMYLLSPAAFAADVDIGSGLIKAPGWKSCEPIAVAAIRMRW